MTSLQLHCRWERSEPASRFTRSLTPPSEATEPNLEGIVAKRKKDAYGAETVWYKVKNQAYTQMEGRGELFHPRRR
jgi:hypothetical protein